MVSEYKCMGARDHPFCVFRNKEVIGYVIVGLYRAIGVILRLAHINDNKRLNGEDDSRTGPNPVALLRACKQVDGFANGCVKELLDRYPGFNKH